MCKPMQLGGFLLAAAAFSFGALLAANPARAAGCEQHHLVFRWTSGAPLAQDVIQPPEEALQNAPFLQDPELVSVTVDRTVQGPVIDVRLAPAPAKILAEETTAHLGQQMLMTLDGEVILAGVVPEPILRGTAEIRNLHDRPQAEELARRLRLGGAGSTCLSAR